MTPLERMQQRCEAATEGPCLWHPQDKSMMILGQPDCDVSPGSVLWVSRCKACYERAESAGDEYLDSHRCAMPTKEDGAFIAMARQDLPAVLSALQDIAGAARRLEDSSYLCDTAIGRTTCDNCCAYADMGRPVPHHKECVVGRMEDALARHAHLFSEEEA